MGFLALLVILVQGVSWLVCRRGTVDFHPDQRRAVLAGFRLTAMSQLVALTTSVALEAQSGWLAGGMLALQLAIALGSLAAALRLRRLGTARRAAQLEWRLVLRKLCHETCTPLTAIVGFAEMLDSKTIGMAVRRDLTRRIARLAGRLADQVRDLLEVTERDRELVAQPTAIALDALLADQLVIGSTEADRTGVQLHLVVEENVPRQVEVDGRLLRTAITHLLDNALAHSAATEVQIRIAAEGGRLWVAVEDNGRGLTPEVTERLAADPGGTGPLVTPSERRLGLGLPLCRRIARACGQGDDSELRFAPAVAGGAGLRVSLAFAYRPVAESDGCLDAGVHDAEAALGWLPHAGERARLTGRRILLVEDGPENREIVRHILHRAGADVEAAVHGRDALEVLAIGPERFDLVLMDMDMPVMDGYQATAIARARGYQVPIVALSAHSLEADQRKSLDVGCDAFVSKPVVASELVEFCSELFGSRHVVPGADQRPTDDGLDRVQWLAHRTVSPDDEPEDLATRGARSRFADDPELASLLADYVAAMTGYLNDLEAALSEDDADRIRLLAHRLKGSGASYGYDELGASAAACEAPLKAGATLASIAAPLDELKRQLGRVAVGAESDSGVS